MAIRLSTRRLIVSIAIIRAVCGLSYRVCEGLVQEALCEENAPDFTTLQKRISKVDAMLVNGHSGIAKSKASTVRIIPDGTGLTPGNRGEWIRKTHKLRRGFIRLSVMIDQDTREILAFRISDEKTGDMPQLKGLIDNTLENLEIDPEDLKAKKHDLSLQPLPPPDGQAPASDSDEEPAATIPPDVEMLGNATGITVSCPSSDRSRGQQAPPVMDIDSVIKSYPQSVPEWASQAAASHDPKTPIPPIGVDGTFAFPLEINSAGYLLGGPVNTLVPHAVGAGQPVTIKVTVHDPTPIAYFAIYLNLPDDEISHLDSDAQIIWNNDQTYVVDRSGLMQDAAVTLSEDPDDPAMKTFTVTVVLSEGMGESNMSIRTWNSAGQLTEVRVFDAIAVKAPEPEPVEVDPEPVEVDDPAERDVLAIRMWSGFEPESISDAQLLASLGLDYPGADVPSWVMTELRVLAAQGDITVEQFRTALEYVLDNS